MTNLKLKLQDRILFLLADKIDDFYLAGGTALSRYYFQHRISEDLDFFTKDYGRSRIQEIIHYLEGELNKKIELRAERTDKNRVKMMAYYVFYGKSSLKIDFVEDYLRLLQPCRKIDGIFVLSLSDIYLRKIYTVIGTTVNVDLIGRKVASGRQEAKDFYDLYFLSHTFKGLSEFAWKHCNASEREMLIHWYRTYDRMHIKTGLLDLELEKTKAVDFRKIEQHFKEEIDQLIEKEIKKI